ncbi:MFS transporter [Arcanobacterium pinnipediorum]|uniref:MFS transporter n=1 Tax=Arcanobacterium pinnipediorum TaxID=1503041 RepID=A0ABY5AHD3_9ACTO|nr:MFS transporter [Arcanobacterium pinnipediorum]USR79405.1 MFS transporter [Arcanobacterium pinnipediorum]
MSSISTLIHRLLPYPQFRRLLTIRLLSQTGDGLFQAGLASIVLFSPYRLGTIEEVALAFAVILLPFTIIVPFVGPLLDRWDRRRILLWGNYLRAGGVFSLAIALAIKPTTSVMIVGALVLLGINRFILAALSAGLPHTLPTRLLVVANSLIPTVGSIAAGCGGLLGLGLTVILAPGTWRDVTALGLAGLFFIAASATAATMNNRCLGPLTIKQWSVRQILTQLMAGLSYLVHQRHPAYALAIMTAHRLLYGLELMMLLALSKSGSLGLFPFATVLAVSFSGNALAILITPVAHRRIGAHNWILCSLTLAVTGHLAWALSSNLALVYLVFALFGLSVQGVKISVDTIVQRDVGDAYRGRAFSLYDMFFNAALVGAGVLAAFFLPPSGWSTTVNIGCALAYGTSAFIYRSVVRSPQ